MESHHEQLLGALHTTIDGLQQTDAESRIKQYGPNALKAQRQATAFGLLLRQFRSPLVLILIFATIVSAFLGQWIDASIVLAVVLGAAAARAAHEGGLQGATNGLGAREVTLDGANRNSASNVQATDTASAGTAAVNDEMAGEWNQPSRDVGSGDRGGADEGALRVGLFETQLKPHHKVDPRPGRS